MAASDGPTPSRLEASPGEAPTKQRKGPAKEKRSKIGFLLLIAVVAVGAIMYVASQGGGSDEQTSTSAADDKPPASAPKTFTQPLFSVKVPSQFETTKDDITEDQGTSVGTELDSDGVKVQVVIEKQLTDPLELINTADSKNEAKVAAGTEGFEFYRRLNIRPVSNDEVQSEGAQGARYEYLTGPSKEEASSVVTYSFIRGGRTWRTRVQVDGDTPNDRARADEISKQMAVSLKPRGGPPSDDDFQ